MAAAQRTVYAQGDAPACASSTVTVASNPDVANVPAIVTVSVDPLPTAIARGVVEKAPRASTVPLWLKATWVRVKVVAPGVWTTAAGPGWISTCPQPFWRRDGVIWYAPPTDSTGAAGEEGAAGGLPDPPQAAAENAAMKRAGRAALRAAAKAGLMRSTYAPHPRNAQ